ncbi:MAG: hypothetical protein J6J22_00070 [Alistipes sp.]|nr:hypothetical protein [Alistipes sp.]
MYSEKLEGLIKAALADGVLTEKEKQVLFNRAEMEGIDLNEFEMVLNARVLEMRQKAKSTAPKSDKQTEVKKCPACGEIIPFLVGVCPVCGHSFDLSKTDVEIIQKLEKDCHALSNIANPAWPIILAINIILGSLSIVLIIMGIEFGDESPGWWPFILLVFGNLFTFPFVYTSSEGNNETDRIDSTKINQYTFDIRSKINSTKLIYANNKLIMARLSGLEEYVNENLNKRQKRTKTIIITALVVAVAILFVGFVM